MSVLPKHMLVIKNGKVIIRPIKKYVTSEEHLDYGVVGPMQALPHLEPGESIMYLSDGRTVIIGGQQEAGEGVFIDLAK